MSRRAGAASPWGAGRAEARLEGATVPAMCSTKVKICGITRLADAELAVSLGAWSIGMVFYRGSPRRCPLVEAGRISAALRRRVQLTGVFVNAPLEEIVSTADQLQLSIVQLHGDEGPAFCSEIARRTGAKVSKAIQVADGGDIREIERFHVDYHLLDAGGRQERRGARADVGHGAMAENGGRALRGGTGETFDWSLLESRRSQVPLVLSGGLTPENVCQAIALVHPFAVDAASGVEAAPGIKDPQRMRAFFAAVSGSGSTAPSALGAPSGLDTAPGCGPATARLARSNAPAVAAVEHHYGPYGGQFVPETLMPALIELEQAWVQARGDHGFEAELQQLLRRYVGRPTPLYRASRLSQRLRRSIYLKREDLNHTGSHKLNNALGQALLAKRMGKSRIIAETGAGQHGVATATACALLDLECVVYMGEEDVRRQQPNVQRMRLLGARVQEVTTGARTLKEATSEAIRDWVSTVAHTHYVIGSAVGPAPYPAIVRELQSVIGAEAREQILQAEGRLPRRVIACVGGGSNALGIFSAFLDDGEVELIGVEAGGEGIDTPRHGAPLTVGGRPGILHGARSAVMQDEEGQILEAHSISAGLDYPGTGPQHAHLRDTGRARYFAVTDAEAVDAFKLLTRLEGIIPALESAHALAWALEQRGGELDLICLSGRGDKDLAEVLRLG